MRWLLPMIVVLFAWLHGAPAHASMPCHEAPKMVGTQTPIRHGGYPPVTCAADCPMHGGAILRVAPVPAGSVRVAQAGFADMVPPATPGWLTSPALGPPRLVG